MNGLYCRGTYARDEASEARDSVADETAEPAEEAALEAALEIAPAAPVPVVTVASVLWSPPVAEAAEVRTPRAPVETAGAAEPLADAAIAGELSVQVL